MAKMNKANHGGMYVNESVSADAISLEPTFPACVIRPEVISVSSASRVTVSYETVASADEIARAFRDQENVFIPTHEITVVRIDERKRVVMRRGLDVAR